MGERMTTRLMTIAKELILKPKTGISEKESYFNVHFLNARNEVSEIQRILDIELNKACEISEAGRRYTRYTVKDGDQIRKIANLYNEKLRYQQEKWNRCLDIPFFTESNIQHSINLLGGIQ